MFRGMHHVLQHAVSELADGYESQTDPTNEQNGLSHLDSVLHELLEFEVLSLDI